MRYLNGEQSREMDLDLAIEGDDNLRENASPKHWRPRPRTRCWACRSALNQSFTERGIALCLVCILNRDMWGAFRRHCTARRREYQKAQA